MRIARIEVRNFRSLRHVDFGIQPLTALVGENGTGKSALLRALAFFFAEPGIDVDDEDCWGGDRGLVVEVSVTFTDLPPDLCELIGPHFLEDGQFTLTRRSEPVTEGRRQSVYLCRARRASRFQPLRQEPSKRKALSDYNELRKEPPFTDLHSAGNHAKMLDALAAWETEHPEQVELVEDRSISIGSGGTLDLAPWFSIAIVPAVHDATEEAAEGQGTLFRRLVERLVRPETNFDEGLGQLDEYVRDQYQQLVDRGMDALRRAEETLSRRVSVYAPGSTVQLGWRPQLWTLRPPTVFARLVEAGFPAEVGRQGHGLQRSYLLALLQELASRDSRGPGTEGDSRPLLTILIEEPELYQHPTRARLFSRVLADLAEESSEHAQVIFATHSPLFVSLDRVEGIRLFRRVAGSDPPETVVRSVDLEAAAVKLWQASGGRGDPFTAESLRVHLRRLLDTPLSEGFFARVAVLVEGDADRAMLAATAEAQGLDLHELGVALLPAGGKGYLDKPLLIFRELEIPTYLVFDGDADKALKDGDTASNLRLLRLVGGDEQEKPPTRVEATWTCFEENMVVGTRTDVGEKAFDEAGRAACQDLEVPESKKEDPLVLRATVEKLFAKGSPPATLMDIVEQIRSLAQGGSA